ncbi:MAG: low molecular weight phosphatase family protein [Candidatus Magasanikbacteria bacterium]|nr:low molecular weight phosphatase family protein [Candidatus Magasanikbacteria bacterium]
MTILFICQGNSGRSQIAEAFFNSLSKKGKAMSAGIKPDERIHPWTVRVMKEVGLDVSQQTPRLLTKGLIQKADKIIVMDSDLLKIAPLKDLSKIESWQIEEPLGKSLKRVKRIRNEIREKVEQLINKIDTSYK